MDTNIKTLNEVEYKFVPHETSDKLVVSFNRHNGGTDFFKYKTLLTDQQTNVLFLSNDNNWYLDNDGGERYRNTLKPYVDKYGKENVFFFGSSMGAYGALLHGLHFGVNVYASNPQINKDTVLKDERPQGGNYANSLVKKDIKLVSTVDMYGEHGNTIESVIYLLFGDAACDVSNLKEFLTAIPKKVKLIVDKVPNNEHDFWTHSVEDIMGRFEITRKLREITYSNYKQ